MFLATSRNFFYLPLGLLVQFQFTADARNTTDIEKTLKKPIVQSYRRLPASEQTVILWEHSNALHVTVKNIGYENKSTYLQIRIQDKVV